MITNQLVKREKLVMKDDIMFKAFFSRVGSEKFLKDFLSAILGKNMKIKKVIHDSRLEQLARESKYGVLDLDVELDDGEIINIEMQLKNYHNIEERTTFYASKKIVEQIGPAQKYEDLKKVIVIAILDYSLTPLPEYITKTVRVAEQNRQYELNNNVTYYYIELEKFRNQNPDMKEPLNQWLAFIDMERGDLLEMAKKNSKIIKEAFGEYEVLTGNDEVKRLAEIRLMSKLEEQSALATARKRGEEKGLKEGMDKGLKEGMDKGLKEGMSKGLKEGMNKGLKEGIERGNKEAKIEMAKKLLKTNIPIKQIEEITELSENDIIEIKNGENI